MKNLYRLQTLLVVLLALLNLPWATSQIPEPITVKVKNSGSTYTDQFPASTDYAWSAIQSPLPTIGSASFGLGPVANSLKVTFTPTIGAIGTTDYIVTYYTLTPPMHPVTRWYRFIVNNEAITANNDQFLVDLNGMDVPLPVLENDTTTGSPISLTSVSVSNAGVASINAEGDQILFTPDTGFIGDTWIQYIACDTAGNCGEGKAHVLVRDPNVVDALEFKKYLLNEEPLEVLTPFQHFTVSIAPSNGTLDSINPITWIYTPNEDYTGNDTFELDLVNSVTRTYYITVYDQAVNVQAKDDRYYVRPGLSVTFNVLNNDLLDEYELSSFTNPAKGVLFDLGNGLFTYTPNTGYRGVDKFTYTSCFDDTVYCETATVLLHVTDLEPENQFTYKLQTTEDLPLTIDYPIAYTDFSYIISDNPDHGTLTFYDNVQEIPLPCDTIESYNMLVYTPEAGYTGEDHFEYYYCIVPSNICYLVKVDMNVIAEPEPETCPCIIDCVWPGDGNRDGRVDMNDILTLGHRLGASGPVRNYDDPSMWFGQHGPNWPGSGPAGIFYQDANGDGRVTEEDLDIINTHYNRTNDIVVRDVNQKLPYQFSLIPVQWSVDSGDVVILNVSLGNANIPVLDMKGVKFSVNVPPAFMDSASVQVYFHQNSWLAEGSPNVELGKVPWDGRIDAGFAKANGNGSSGFGVIGTIVFIIEEDAEGFKSGDHIIRVPVRIESGVAMDHNGTEYDLEGDEIVLEYKLYDPSRELYKMIMYPNPSQDMVNIHLNGKTSIETIRLIDPQGRIIRTISSIDTKYHQLDVSSLPVGLYYVQVHHAHGLMTQLLSVIR